MRGNGEVRRRMDMENTEKQEMGPSSSMRDIFMMTNIMAKVSFWMKKVILMRVDSFWVKNMAKE